jgi:RNA polymerase sigma-70 factor (ECF subfamily)
VAVITGFGSFDPRKGTGRAWVSGIARRVYASHCEAYSQQQHKMQRLAGRRDLDPDQVEELVDRIDAERAGRHLVSELARLPEGDRAVVELVDMAGLRPKEAAAALGLAPGTVRMRLMRTRARLRREALREQASSSTGRRWPASGRPRLRGGISHRAAWCWPPARADWPWRPPLARWWPPAEPRPTR